MNIEAILISKGFVLNPTTKWMAINDPRPAFKKAFGPVARFGKLQGTHMYVTLDPVKAECERLMAASGLCVRHLPSTRDSSRAYPGFDTAGFSEAAFAQLVDALRLVVDRHL
jgi:hypothetical protein